MEELKMDSIIIARCKNGWVVSEYDPHKSLVVYDLSIYRSTDELVTAIPSLLSSMNDDLAQQCGVLACGVSANSRIE